MEPESPSTAADDDEEEEPFANLHALHPNHVDMDHRLYKHSDLMMDQIRKKGTKSTLQNKITEYREYCEAVYKDDLYKHVLNQSKVYRYMFYQISREQKPRGGSKKKKKKFDHADYKKVMKQYDADPDAPNVVIPVLKKPISLSSFDAYKAAIKSIYYSQKQYGQCSANWDDIWTEAFNQLKRQVTHRAPMLKKLNYEEKVNGEFAPYAIADDYPKLEAELWQDSQEATSYRNVTAYLRHRYCLLHLTSGILRCESLHRAELSDFLHVWIPMKETDIHPMMMMVNQLLQGKTNHGRKMYGRATRHKNVFLCCVGALAFYLMYRFFVTSEFKDFTVEDWMDNEKWFDIKLLIDVNGSDNTVEMKNDSYGDHIKRILKRLNMIANKILHLGRNIGSRIMEFLEAEQDDIDNLGNWANKTFNNHYSCKLPIKPVRTIAGYSGDTAFYFNTRTRVDPSDQLLRMTPMGEWVYDAYDGVIAADSEGKKQTALHVLSFFKELNKVFLQDAAVMQLLDEDRATHPLFTNLPVFASVEFAQFKLDMKRELENEESPLDANLEKVLPGVHQWHRATHQELSRVTTELRDLKDEQQKNQDETRQNFGKIIEGIQDLGEKGDENQRALAMTFIRVGHSIADGMAPETTQIMVGKGIEATDKVGARSALSRLSHPCATLCPRLLVIQSTLVSSK